MASSSEYSPMRFTERAKHCGHGGRYEYAGQCNMHGVVPQH